MGLDRLLFVWPAAEFSTYDVARGLNRALKRRGDIQVFDYMLSRRIQMCTRGLEALYGDTDSAQMLEDDDGSLIASPLQVGALLHASEGLLHVAVANGCRWVLVISGMGLHPDALVTARRCGIKVATYFTEGPYETNETAELRIAKLTDIAFVNERYAVDKFPCSTVVYLSHSYDPEAHFPKMKKPHKDDRCDVLMFGTGFRERVELIRAIDWTGIDLKMGGFWQDTVTEDLQKYVCWPCMSNDLVVNLYAGCKILLNCHRYAEDAYSCNPRVFEAAACGVFQISDYRPEIADIFGASIPTYEPGNAKEAKALIDFYLAYPEERRKCVRDALNRVKPYTFDRHAKTVIQTIEQHQKVQKEVA